MRPAGNTAMVVDLICQDCGAKCRHDPYHVRRTATDKAHCPKCGSTFLVRPYETNTEDQFLGGSYDRMMQARGWTITHQHVDTPDDACST